MRKFIYSNIEIDLSNREITIVKENHWFSDRFFTKFSFPVELPLTASLNLALGNITDHNAVDVISYVEGYYYEFGEEHKAVLELERLTDVASFIIRFGFEELPNWNKKLAALPLEQRDLTGTNIRAHANSIIDSTYPAVNYNFPQIHITEIDTDSDKWAAFSNRLNARDSGLFLLNEFDNINVENNNRTIMQPLPSLLHVIQQGFADLGKTVNGSIFSNLAFAKAYIFHFSEYYRSDDANSYEMVSTRRDHDGTFYNIFGTNVFTVDYNFYLEFPPLEFGLYQLTGVVESYGDEDFYRFQIGNTVLSIGNGFFGFAQKNYYIDVTFGVVPGMSNILFCRAAQTNYNVNPDGTANYDHVWLDVTLTQIGKYDSNGNLITSLIDASAVDLRKCVPDITFGELMTRLKNRFAIDIIPEGDNYRIDFVKDQIDSSEVIDLSAYLVRYPQRSFTQGDSYALKYPQIDSEDFLDQGVLVTRDGVESLTTQLISNDVQEVNVEYIPLPLKTVSSRPTAVQIGDDSSALYIVQYDGLQDNDNFCVAVNNQLRYDYDTYLSRIYDYKIKGQPYQWSFVLPELVAKKIKERSRVFAYNKIFVVQKIQTTNLGREVVQMRLDVISSL